jgi:SAM-dependent methyltransferase
MRAQGRVYNAKFYRQLEATRHSAGEILPIVIELLKPSSMVDFGCGAGQWLAAALELGIADILGIEGEWISAADLAIPREKLLIHDLTSPLDLGRRFDLALSLEVAEHLPPSQARIFVKGLTDAADRVLFSAAIPFQGGRNHQNEQWPQYWAGLFSDFGYGCYDVIRPRVWENTRIVWYYAQNCLLFARPDSVGGLGSSTLPLALVHPAAWRTQAEKWNSPGKLLERLPKAVISRLSGR